jgi:hypothetical protein
LVMMMMLEEENTRWYFYKHESRVGICGSSVSIVSDIDWTTEVRSPAGETDFSSCLCVQTRFVAHSTSQTMGNAVISRGYNSAGAWCWYLSPCNAEVKNE